MSALPMASKNEILGAISGAGSQLIASMGPEVRAAAIAAVSKAISRTYCVCIATSVLSLLFSVALKWECVVLEM